MRYQITGKQIDIGEALQTHVKTELDGVVGKYAGRPTDANIVFSKSGHEYVCEAEVHLSTGLTAQAKGKAGIAKSLSGEIRDVKSGDSRSSQSRM